jgi:hypothetical protein
VKHNRLLGAGTLLALPDGFGLRGLERPQHGTVQVKLLGEDDVKPVSINRRHALQAIGAAALVPRLVNSAQAAGAPYLY